MHKRIDLAHVACLSTIAKSALITSRTSWNEGCSLLKIVYLYGGFSQVASQETIAKNTFVTVKDEIGSGLQPSSTNLCVLPADCPQVASLGTIAKNTFVIAKDEIGSGLQLTYNGAQMC